MKIWFQNRRSKFKKILKQIGSNNPAAGQQQQPPAPNALASSAACQSTTADQQSDSSGGGRGSSASASNTLPCPDTTGDMTAAAAAARIKLSPRSFTASPPPPADGASSAADLALPPFRSDRGTASYYHPGLPRPIPTIAGWPPGSSTGLDYPGSFMDFGVGSSSHGLYGRPTAAGASSPGMLPPASMSLVGGASLQLHGDHQLTLSGARSSVVAGSSGSGAVAGGSYLQPWLPPPLPSSESYQHSLFT